MCTYLIIKSVPNKKIFFCFPCGCHILKSGLRVIKIRMMQSKQSGNTCFYSGLNKKFIFLILYSKICT